MRFSCSKLIILNFLQDSYPIDCLSLSVFRCVCLNKNKFKTKMCQKIYIFISNLSLNWEHSNKYNKKYNFQIIQKNVEGYNMLYVYFFVTKFGEQELFPLHWWNWLALYLMPDCYKMFKMSEWEKINCLKEKNAKKYI